MTPQQIGAARVLLQRKARLVDIAVSLGVRSGDLDQALWSHIDISTDDLFAGRGRPIKYQPDFDVVER